MALTTKQKNEIADRACLIIFSNEGNYGSVNKDDNGAVSIGKVQWHGNRALALLRKVCNMNKNQGNQMLGSTLYNEIMNNGTNWGTRVVTQAEADRISTLLQTNEGKAAQDSQAKSDVLTYVNKGIKYGLENPEALIYFADGVNQYGTASSLWKNIAKRALEKGGTLDAMYLATKELTSKYMSRRTKVYNALKGSVQEENESIKITPDETTVRMIQKWINDYCHAGIAVDGEFGPKSRKGMVKALQHCINTEFNYEPELVVDGSFGPLSKKVCPSVSRTKNKNGTLVFIAQCLLYVNGYDPQGLDSSFGPDTERATKLFQAEHNLEDDGSVGKLTFAKLVA